MKIRLLLLLLFTLVLAGCAKYKQEIWLNPDGSARLYTELGIESGQLPGSLPGNPLEEGINKNDPNVINKDSGMYEAEGYQNYYVAVTVKDFDEFVKGGKFAGVQYAQESTADGNQKLTLTSPADPQLAAAFSPRPGQLSVVGQDLTLIVHAPAILATDGNIVAQNTVSSTVQWQMPLAEALSELNGLTFSLEYSLDAPQSLPSPTPTPTKTKPTPTVTPQAKTTSAVNSSTTVKRSEPISSTANLSQTDLDADNDWLSDSEEATLGTDSKRVDSDDDGFSDFEEVAIFHSDPLALDTDTDGDGLADSVEQELLHTDPAAADSDEDGDLLPDSVEEAMGTNPKEADSDGDTLSDLIEVYFLQSDPNVSDDDADDDAFPDILEPHLPTQLADTTCTVNISLVLDELLVNDPEEADTNSINGGDEAYMLYLVGSSKDGNFYGPSQGNNSGDPHYVGDLRQWQGEGFAGSHFAGFDKLGPFPARCGYPAYWGVRMIEDDSPFGGQTDMGLLLDGNLMIIHRIPIGWGFSKQNSYHFQGTALDGSYDYELHYTWMVGVAAEATSADGDLGNATDEASAQRVSSLAVERPTDELTEDVQNLLPEAYLSENQRIAFRYQSVWQVMPPQAGYIPMDYIVVPDDATLSNQGSSATVSTTAAQQITIYDPVHIIEAVAQEGYEELSVPEMLEAFVQSSISMSITIAEKDLTEIQLGDKTVTLWQPSNKKANSSLGNWIAFRALDDNINILRFEMSTEAFDEQMPLWLTFAQTVDYQAPSRRLDEIEKGLRKYIAATATGDMETMRTMMCSRNRQTNDMMGTIIGGMFGFDANSAADMMMNFSSGMTELDTSKLFYETWQESAGSAKVLITGIVTLNGNNGRQTMSFRQFGMIGRSLYSLVQENGEWVLCD